MVDIGAVLREYHQDRFQPGELSRIEKECFFAGLRNQSKYLVSHMKDKKEYGPVDMLKELRENDEARYPVNTGKMEGYDRNAGHPDRQMDPVIPHVLEWLQLPKNDRTRLKDFLRGKVSEADCRAYGLREKDFKKRDHILFIKTTPPGSIGTILVFVVPVNRRQVAIDMCHWGAGHQGRDRSLSLMKEQFWWPGMANALFLVIQNCGRCKQFEAKCQIPEMEPILCTQPMELVHVDYVGMEVTVAAQEKPVVKNVLVVVDHFTRYVQAFVTNNHTAHTTARVLYNNFFSIFGFPQKLMSDQGTEFTGDVIATMCKLLGIEKIRTMPYHPQTNGSAERVH